jgi:hypothetical protein
LRVRRQVNLGWWLEKLLTLLLPAALAVAALALWLRHANPDTPRQFLFFGMGLILVLLATAAWWMAKPNFEMPDDALTRLEADRGLKGALSSAKAGILPWPEPCEGPRLAWNMARSGVPALFAALILCAAFLLPISTPAASTPTTPSQPPTWSALEERLNLLEDQDLIEETYLEETREKLEQLKAQPQDQWFSHNSLEATDSLDKSHQAEAQSLKLAADQGGEALNSLLKSLANGQVPDAETLDDLKRAAEAMQGGAMKPNADLLARMEQLDLQDLQKLSPEQLAQLKQNLEALGNALGDAMKDDDRFGDAPGEGEEGEGAGNGGVQRGPGHDPNLFGKRREALELGMPEALVPDDPSRMTPGDLLEIKDSQHDPDTSPSRTAAGGTAANLGQGGDRVWRDSLDPDEQRTLKRFFD